MADIEIYTRAWCPYCAKAKALLRAKGLEWRELDVTHNERLQREMFERSGHHSVPRSSSTANSSAGTTTSLA